MTKAITRSPYRRSPLRHSHKITRRATVMLADSYHTLTMVEITTEMQQCSEDDGIISYTVDHVVALLKARQHLGPTWKSSSGESAEDQQLVGILVAQLTGYARGRITWAHENV
jgi:hypothetical protein